jgi:hypothetical protein
MLVILDKITADYRTPHHHGTLKENRKGHFLERSFFIAPSIEMPKKIPSQIFRWEKI